MRVSFRINGDPVAADVEPRLHLSSRAFDPARVRSPAASKRSFRETGNPASGEATYPALRSRSCASAAARAFSV
jgi:hypothetical protein